MHFFKFYFLLINLSCFNILFAQNYQAINGSSYAGSLAVGNNPAAIVNVPFGWDVTPISIQTKQATNGILIDNYSLLSSPANAQVTVKNGDKKWFAFTNQDIHLLNTRININARSAIGFGANIRNYVYVTGSQANYQDSIQTLADFLTLNINHRPLSAETAFSTWAELYGTYAQTIYDDGTRRVNAGITLKLDRDLAGGYGKAQGLNYIRNNTNNTAPSYLLTDGSLKYGYSSNFDTIDSNKTFNANRKIFVQRSNSSLSADFGFEYTLLADDAAEDANDFAYKTKIGVSLMDVGRNKYKYGYRSRQGAAGKEGINDTVIQNKFTNINSIDDFNDSLAGIANSLTPLTGDFNIYQPTRLMINVDQHIYNNFFLNGELTIPLVGLALKNALRIKDMNLLAITPRWEIKSFGVYLPMLINTQKQFWIGGAFRAGPVLLGTHNFANLFSKNKMANGGFYLALTIRPGKLYEAVSHQPKDKAGGKIIRTLECPSL